MTYEHITFLGRNFKIRTASDADHITRSIRASGTFYEVELLNYLRLLGIRGTCAIDVGANIGNHSIFFAAFLAETVISIEPNTGIIPTLTENLSRVTSRYEVIPAAVGAAPGAGSISFPLENNVGSGKVTKGAGDIEIMTLDEIFPNRGVFLVKIDVEGMELDVLHGARKLLRKNQPDLIIEASTKGELQEIDSFLRPLGYRWLSGWNSTPTHHFSCNNGVLARLRSTAILGYIKIHSLARKATLSFTHGRRLRPLRTYVRAKVSN